MPHASEDRGVDEESTSYACPGCRGALRFEPASLRCDRCAKAYPRRADWVDFIPEQQEDSRGVAPALMHLPVFARVYEEYWRPFFVRIAGGTERPSFDQEVQWVLQSFAPARGGAVLDLSCGPGLFARRFAESGLFSTVYGLDHSEAMLHQCVAAAQRDGTTGLQLSRGDASFLPFSDASLAAVHAGAALHIWRQPNEAICEVARVLRPGGVFVASTFVRSQRRRWQLLTEGFQATSRARVFAESSLENMCAGVGLGDFSPIRRGAFILFTATKQ